jgi:hypothetical protein
VAGVESSKPRQAIPTQPGFRGLNPGHTAGVLAQDGQATEKMPVFLRVVGSAKNMVLILDEF